MVQLDVNAFPVLAGGSDLPRKMVKEPLWRRVCVCGPRFLDVSARRGVLAEEVFRSFHMMIRLLKLALSVFSQCVWSEMITGRKCLNLHRLTYIIRMQYNGETITRRNQSWNGLAICPILLWCPPTQQAGCFRENLVPPTLASRSPKRKCIRYSNPAESQPTLPTACWDTVAGPGRCFHIGISALPGLSAASGQHAISAIGTRQHIRQSS